MNFIKKFLIINIIIFIMCAAVYADENNFRVAIDLFDKGLYFLARENFYTIINNSSNPELIEKSYYYVALSLYYNKEYKNSMYEFSLLFLNFPDTQFKEYSEFLFAKSAFFLNKYLITVRKLKLFLKEYPDTKFKKESKLLIGKSLFFMGYYNKAISYLNKIKNIEANFYIALSYMRLGMNYKALNYFSKINTTKYKEFAIYYSGYIYYKQNNFDKAKKSLLSIKPQSSIIYNKANFILANILFINNDFKQAYDYIKKSNLNTSEYKYLLSEILIRLNKIDNALTILKKITAQKYKDRVNYNIGMILLRKDDYNTALRYFKNVTTENDLKKLSYFSIAKIYFKQNKIDEAFKYISKLSKKDVPEDKVKDYFFIKGVLFFYKENYDKTIINLEKYVKMANENPEGWYYLALSYYKTKNYKNANKYFLLLFNKYKNYRVKIFSFIVELNMSNVNLIIEKFNKIFNELNYENKKLYSFKILKILIEKNMAEQAIKYLNYLNTIKLNNKEMEKLNFLYVKYYINISNFNKANEILSNLINNSDTSEELIKYYYTKYILLSMQNKDEESIIWLKKILDMNTNKNNKYYKKAEEILNKK